MTEQQLLYFTTIVKTGGFMQTALELDISQSAISKHIRALEEELNAPLFDRSRRSAKLTETGTLLYPYACQILSQMYQMRRAARENTASGKEKIIVLALPVIGQIGFYKPIADFEKQHPECQVELIELEEPALFHRILIGDYDLAFAYPDNLHTADNMHFTALVQDTLCAAVDNENELAGKDVLSFPDLAGRPLLAMMKYTCVSHLYDRHFKEHSFAPDIVFRGRPESILAGASAGKGAALLTRMHAGYAPVNGIKLVDFEPTLHIPFGIVTDKNRTYSPLCTALIRACEKYPY